MKQDCTYEMLQAAKDLIEFLRATFPLDKISCEDQPAFNNYTDEDALDQVDYLNLRGFLIE